MKKILAIILASLFIAAPVFAVENRVYVYEEDGKIYYDGALFDDRFMIHEGMVPGGETYTDYLVVENSTSSDYDIYFKITNENNSAKANDLLNYINMKIYLDDELYYDGKARGLDYRGVGVNLTDAIKLKHFEAGDMVTMRVETQLDSSYEDIYNWDASMTHWHFYIADDTIPEPEPDNPEPEPIEPEEIPNNPRTHDSFRFLWIVVLAVSALLLGGAIIYERRVKSRG